MGQPRLSTVEITFRYVPGITHQELGEFTDHMEQTAEDFWKKKGRPYPKECMTTRADMERM